MPGVVDARACVWPILEQARRAVELDLYLVGLMAALAMPDILGASPHSAARATFGCVRVAVPVNAESQNSWTRT